jgi:hypothetical protein
VRCPVKKTVKEYGVQKNRVNLAKMLSQTSKKIATQQVKYSRQILPMIKSLLSMNTIKTHNTALKR